MLAFDRSEDFLIPAVACKEDDSAAAAEPVSWPRNIRVAGTSSAVLLTSAILIDMDCSIEAEMSAIRQFGRSDRPRMFHIAGDSPISRISSRPSFDLAFVRQDGRVNSGAVDFFTVVQVEFEQPDL